MNNCCGRKSKVNNRASGVKEALKSREYGAKIFPEESFYVRHVLPNMICDL